MNSLSRCSGNPRLVGDPIDVVTGTNSDVTVDFELPGAFPLRWRRYYNSDRHKVLGAFGWGHTHDFDRYLIRDIDGISYVDPYGVG